MPSRNKKSDEVDDCKDFKYESDDDDAAVDMGGWSQRQSMCNDGDNANEDSGGSDDEEDHYDAEGNDDDDDDDDEEFLLSTSKEMLDNGDEEKGRSKKGMDARRHHPLGWLRETMAVIMKMMTGVVMKFRRKLTQRQRQRA